jgi:pimeloyl-ACP methyl ester carboxylesterase
MSTWILLRGLMREQRHWGAFPQQLEQALPGARVITLELPGNGTLNTLDSPVDIAGLVAHCRRELVSLGVPPPYGLLAMSMGAMVAAAWAGNHAEEIRACVLINTSFGGFNPPHHRLRPRAWPSLLAFLLPGTDRKREQLIFDLTTRLTPLAATVIETWVGIRQSRPVRTQNALRQMVAAARFHAPPNAPVPTLILASERDGLVDVRCSLEIARRWGCALAIHPAAGHDLPLDDGAWVAQEVQAWLRTASRS